MSDREPLSDEKLREFAEDAAVLSKRRFLRQDTIYASRAWHLKPEDSITALLAEVARLRAELRSLGQDALNALEAQP